MALPRHRAVPLGIPLVGLERTWSGNTRRIGFDPQETCGRSTLFDHLIGAHDQAWRHGQAQRFRGLEINHQLDSFRLLSNWQVGRLSPFQDAAGVASDLTIAIDQSGTGAN
jgi:hypothetical protein